jgi:hypothetical protein
MAKLFSRRTVLEFSCTGIAAAGVGGWAVPALAANPTQDRWFFCVNCNALVFGPASVPNGTIGVCPHPQNTNGHNGHLVQGLDFTIAHSASASDVCDVDTPKTQAGWRFCTLCSVMFFALTPNQQDDRHCAANNGGKNGHKPLGHCFNLNVNRQGEPIGTQAGPKDQRDWRFCAKCTTLFWDGDVNNKGACPAGGSHAAVGDFIVLDHA